MSTSAADSWDSVRQTFADQFEQDGTNFVYRRSQKGEAFRVSAEERRKFIEQFDQNVRRAKWISYAGLTVVFGGIIGFSLLKGFDLSPAAMVVGFGVVMIPYFVYYRWAWVAPARELAGRTPIAGERPADEVRRLQFQRMTYAQLAGAGVGGLAIPFVGSRDQDVFSGWNRLWLLFGGALVLLAAVQAFRKWRFEQDDSYGNLIQRPSTRDLTESAQDSTPTVTNRLLPYVPLAAILLAFAFIAYTPAGQQLAKQANFWPIVTMAAGAWALFTVVRGFIKGQTEPFARGFYTTYQRETQRKRYWASMTWNAVFGCLLIWLAFTMSRDATAQPLRDRCNNDGRKYQPQDVIRACTQLIAGKASLGGWSRADVFVNRGIAYDDLGRPEPAITDYTTALRLQPKYPEAYYDRALAYEQIGDVSRALNDYGNAIKQNRQDADAYLNRGLIYLNMRKLDDAISDFTRSHDLQPRNAWPLANRGIAYAWKRDTAQAKRDFAAVRAIDPKNQVLLHGEGLIYMLGGDLEAAIDRLTAALAQDPSDVWALQMRADAYQQMGKLEDARRDRKELASRYQATRPRSAPDK